MSADNAGQEFLGEYYAANAGTYDRWMRSYDRWLLGDRRAGLCQQASGRTLEIAVGTGINLPLYSAAVDLTAIDYSPEMLAVARRRVERLGRPVDLRVGDAHALEFDDASFDTVLTTLFLSSVPEPERATREIHRVLRPGGRVLVLDHVRSPFPPLRLLQRVTRRFVTRRTGVDLTRDPLDYLGSVGFTVEHVERSKLGLIEIIVASRPSDPHHRGHHRP